MNTRNRSYPEVPGGPHLRTVAMPRDANPSGAIFGGWTLSQMDIAGAICAAQRVHERLVTVAIDAMQFRAPIHVGDEVSVFCWLEEARATSIKVRIQTWTRRRIGQEEAHKVTEGVFTYVALDEAGKPTRIELDDGE